jgi:hypothetical protein
MQHKFFAITLLSLLPLIAFAQSKEYFKWVDKDGVTHYGDSIPAEYAELPKEVVNDYGVTVDELEGKKTEEQLEQERIENEIRVARELQKRADQALLATYLSVDEIKLHRDRRVEMSKAQSRVTELYLRNLERRLGKLLKDASNFKPYSDDPDAPMVDSDLAEEIRLTRATIARHESNLEKFQVNEDQVIARFEGDINRFKTLKGIE